MKRKTSWLQRLGCVAILVAAAAVNFACSSSGTGIVQVRAISNLNPSSAKAGSPGFTLKVTGTGFQNTDVVLWNGAALATQPIGDPSELDAQVPASLIANTGTVTVAVSGKPFNGGQPSAGVTFTITPGVPVPDLTITKSHSGSFTQGQTGATFTINVSNAGTASTSGSVTVSDTIPTGLTGTAAAGTGWACTVAATVMCTRSDVLAADNAYPSITLTVNVASNAPGSITNTVTVSGGGSATHTGSDSVTVNPTGTPNLTVSKSHSGNFTQGQTGATFSINVSNSGTVASSGSVSVSDTIPSGMTATAATGTGWSCTVAATVTCTRGDALGAGNAYPTITLTVSVASNAPASVTNTAMVSGGGSTTHTGNDTVTVTPTGTPNLTISKSHSGNFTQGQTGATYSINVSNAGTGSTSGTVTVSDTIPSGMSATGASGTGWSCTVAVTVMCTRSDVLTSGNAYPTITLTVSVASNAAATITNTVTVSGGGSALHTASDPTTVNPSGGAASLTITMTGSSSVSENNNATAQIVIKNVGGSATSGTVTVTLSSLSGFFTQFSLTGDPWACDVNTLICTRSDALAPGASYPPIALTYQVGFGSGASLMINGSVSGGGAATTNTSLTTTVIPCSPGSGTLCGQFALFIEGYTSAGPKAIVASFTADGAGHITAGIMDINSMGAPAVGIPILTASPTAYNFESNGFGNLTLNTSAGTFVFKFTLNAFGNFADVIEFEPSGTSSGSGYLVQQNPTFTPPYILGGYAFGLSGGLGGSSAGVRVGMIGAITANGACGFSATGATGTINNGGTVSTAVNFSGTLNPGACAVDSTTGRGTGTFTSITGSPAPSFSTVHFAYYVVGTDANNNVSSMFIISTDQTSATQPLLSTQATRQRNSPFNTNAAIDCGVSGNPTGSTGCVIAAVGATGGNSLTGDAHVTAGRASVTTQSNTAGAMSLLLDDNKGGVITSGTVTATYSYAADGTGTITPTSGSGTAFVLIGTDAGITMGTGGNVSRGFFAVQLATNISTTSAANFLTRPLSAGTVNVTNTLSTATITPTSPTPSSSGTLSGNTRFWDSGMFQNAGALSGTYTTDGATGRGTGTSNIAGAATTAYHVVNAQFFILIGLTPGDTSPVLMTFQTP